MYKLRDLRQTISVLFQDYTHFPLSVRQYCTALLYGSLILPLTMVRFATTSRSVTRLAAVTTAMSVQLRDSAAQSRSSRSFLMASTRTWNALRAMNTRDRPKVPRRSSATPSMYAPCATLRASGPQRRCRLAGVRCSDWLCECNRHVYPTDDTISQVDDSARTFMRSVVREDAQVGLLLFDEPSASLDPAAEHGERRLHRAVSVNSNPSYMPSQISLSGCGN